MSKAGTCEGYLNTPCPKCGRYRLEHWSGDYSICEKCSWCEELGRYVEYDDELFMDYCNACQEWETCPSGKLWHENGKPADVSIACCDFKPKENE